MKNTRFVLYFAGAALLAAEAFAVQAKEAHVSLLLRDADMQLLYKDPPEKRVDVAILPPGEAFHDLAYDYTLAGVTVIRDNVEDMDAAEFFAHMARIDADAMEQAADLASAPPGDPADPLVPVDPPVPPVDPVVPSEAETAAAPDETPSAPPPAADKPVTSSRTVRATRS